MEPLAIRESLFNPSRVHRTCCPWRGDAKGPSLEGGERELERDGGEFSTKDLCGEYTPGPVHPGFSLRLCANLELER